MVAEEPVDVGEIHNLDRLIHQPARLAILVVLYVVEAADFVYLQTRTELTKGNLSAHLSKLEEAGYIEIEKGFEGKYPRTLCRMTGAGRAAFRVYLATLKRTVTSLPD